MPTPRFYELIRLFFAIAHVPGVRDYSLAVAIDEDRDNFRGKKNCRRWCPKPPVSCGGDGTLGMDALRPGEDIEGATSQI